jgi:hypothetical protein
MGSEWILLLGRLASTVSGQGPVAGCCDEPSGSCATEFSLYLCTEQF